MAGDDRLQALDDSEWGRLRSDYHDRIFGYESPLPLRYAGLTMCSVFLLGLVALPFLPETKDKPLPE